MRAPVRLAVKAVVVRDRSVLLLHHRYYGHEIYELPGGGQRFGETVYGALEREVLEETGVRVQPGSLLWVRDYIGANHEFAGFKGQRRLHQVELVFAAEPAPVPVIEPAAPDTHQVGTVWATASQMLELPLKPAAFKPVIEQVLSGSHDAPARYLGDVN